MCVCGVNHLALMQLKLSRGPMTAIIIAAIDNNKTQIHTLSLCTANFTLPEVYLLFTNHINCFFSPAGMYTVLALIEWWIKSSGKIPFAIFGNPEGIATLIIFE